MVKVNVYLKDMDNFSSMNEVYEKVSNSARFKVEFWADFPGPRKLLPTPKPARTCIQAAKLPGDVDIEIEAIAAV